VLRPRYFFTDIRTYVFGSFVNLYLTWHVYNQNHRFSYGEPMTVESSTQAICDLALRFGEGDEESMVSFVYVITPPPEHKKQD
jgi:hypothetical protein